MSKLVFPRYVFKSPGYIKFGASYKTYEQTLVANQEEFDAWVKVGWFEDKEDAIDAPKIDKAVKAVGGEDKKGK